MIKFIKNLLLHSVTKADKNLVVILIGYLRQVSLIYVIFLI